MDPPTNQTQEWCPDSFSAIDDLQSKEHKSGQLKIYEFKDKKEKQRDLFHNSQHHYGNNRLFYCIDIVLAIAADRLIFYEQLDESFEAFTGLIKRRGDTNLVQIKRIDTSNVVKFVEWLRDRLLRIIRSCCRLRDTYCRVNKYSWSSFKTLCFTGIRIEISSTLKK